MSRPNSSVPKQVGVARRLQTVGDELLGRTEWRDLGTDQRHQGEKGDQHRPGHGQPLVANAAPQTLPPRPARRLASQRRCREVPCVAPVADIYRVRSRGSSTA